MTSPKKRNAEISALTTTFYNEIIAAINKALSVPVPRNELVLILERIMDDLSCFLGEVDLFTERQKRGKLAKLGERFSQGRKRGTGSAVRKAIERELRRDRDLKPAALWERLSQSPPRGWSFRDNAQGKYIDGPKGAQGMTYRRFQNLVREVAKAL